MEKKVYPPSHKARGWPIREQCTRAADKTIVARSMRVPTQDDPVLT